VIRYAGDEFVVVARDAEPAQVLDRVDRLRERLRTARADGPEVRFSVGHAVLSAHGDAEAAIRAADEAMYADKPARTRRLRASSPSPSA
jgi:diguanylate cyclase (GGDEF)-like protein